MGTGVQCVHAHCIRGTQLLEGSRALAMDSLGRNAPRHYNYGSGRRLCLSPFPCGQRPSPACARQLWPRLEGRGRRRARGAGSRKTSEAHRVVLGQRLVVEGPVHDPVPVVNPLLDAVVIPLGGVLGGRQPLGVCVEDVPQDQLALLTLGGRANGLAELGIALASSGGTWRHRAT